MAADPKQELHELVDRLSDEEANEALVHIRRLLTDAMTSGPASQEARPRGRPLTAADLYADILPDDETPDMLIEAVRRWRHEGGHV